MKTHTNTLLASLITLTLTGAAGAAELYAVPTFENGATASSERFVTEIVTVNIAAGVTGSSAVDIDNNQTYQVANDTTGNAFPRLGNNIDSNRTPGYVLFDGADDDYIEIAISAVGGLNLESLTFDFRRGTTSASVRGYDLDVSINGGGFVDLDESNIGANRNDASPSSFDIDLSAPTYQGIDSIAFRISERGGTIELTNIAINGEVVPEPGSLAVIGLGSLCLLRRRRDK